MGNFNNSRSFFPCKPDCPERTSTCHSYCKRYIEKRAELDRINEAERRRKESAAYTVDSINRKRDKNAKKRKNYGMYKPNKA